MTTITLRDYQERAVQEIRQQFRERMAPALLVMPTGSGKTFTFSYVAASGAEKGRRIIIIVHRKELLLQASGSLRALGIDHGMISPHFTPNPHALIQVASVDTLLIRLKKQPAKYRFDIAIFDEAHHVIAGNKWGRAWEELGRPLMLGVTATPVRTDGKGLGEHSAGVFKSMVLGPGVGELIALGRLINPAVYTSLELPDLSGLKKDKDGEYNRVALAERVDKPRITGSAVEHYSKICPGAKSIVFCSSIKHAKHVRDEFNGAGYRFELLCGAPEMSDSERTAINRKLRRGEINGACTVDLVSEGYDLPDLECCIMLRPTASEALYLQQVGRIMRPSPTKEGCWLLDCVGNVGAVVKEGFKLKHGFPDQERFWTLDGRKKKRRGKKDDDDISIEVRQCPNCYLVHAMAPKCPACGHEYPAGGRGGLEQVEGDLQKITPEMQARLAHDARLKQGRAKTVDEMVQQLGYSRERAAKILEARAEKDALTNALISDLQAWRQETGQTALDILGVPMMGIKSQKPKALKDLRQRFDDHRAAYATGQGLTGSNSGTSALF